MARPFALLLIGARLASGSLRPSQEECAADGFSDLPDDECDVRDSAGCALNALQQRAHFKVTGACDEGSVNVNWATTADPACEVQSLPGCFADGKHPACRYCGPPRNGDPQAPTFPPCPAAGTTIATTQPPQTNPVTTTPPPYCSLSVTLFCPYADYPGAQPCGDDETDTYSYKATTRCELATGSDSIYIRATGVSPGTCYGTLGRISWYRDATCSDSSSFASLNIFADGDSTEYGCRNRYGEAVNGKWCHSWWSRAR